MVLRGYVNAPWQVDGNKGQTSIRARNIFHNDLLTYLYKMSLSCWRSCCCCCYLFYIVKRALYLNKLQCSIVWPPRGKLKIALETTIYNHIIIALNLKYILVYNIVQLNHLVHFESISIEGMKILTLTAIFG